MENRLIYKLNAPPSGDLASPDNPNNPSIGPDLTENPRDALARLHQDPERSRQLTESRAKRVEIVFPLMENKFNLENDQENLRNFEIESKELKDSPNFWELPIEQKKFHPDFKNWDYRNDSGLAKIFVDMDNLGYPVNEPFYQSVFSIIYNGNKVMNSGAVDQNGNPFMRDPLLHRDQLSQIKRPDLGFDGEMYLKAVDQLVSIQRILLTNAVSTSDATGQSWGDKQGDKINGFIGEVITDVQYAIKERNVPKLLLYGLGGFLAYKGAKHVWEKPGGKIGVTIAGLVSVLYLTGHGKWFENALASAGDIYGAGKDKFSEGKGPGDLGLWFLEQAGADDEMLRLLKAVGITRDNVADVLGGGINSFDNLEYVVSMSTDPEAGEVKKMGINTKMLVKVKDVNLTSYRDLAKESDALDPQAKFIPPNHPLFKDVFPEFASTTTLPKFRKESELKELTDQSSMIKTGGFNSQFGNYVVAGKMLYNMVSAMKIAYAERIRMNDSKYRNLTFDEAINSEKLKEGSVQNYLDALREYTALDNARFIENMSLIASAMAGDAEGRGRLDFKINGINTRNNVYSTVLHGVPFQAYHNSTTNKIQLYLPGEIKETEQVSDKHTIFLTMPDELKDGIFESKLGKIVMNDREKILKKIPKKDVEINGKKYKHKDFTVGSFKRVAGEWVVDILSESELKDGKEVITHIMKVTFNSDDGKPLFTPVSRNDFALKIDAHKQYQERLQSKNEETFDFIRDAFNYRNIVDANYNDPMIFEPIYFDETNRVYKFKLNGMNLIGRHNGVGFDIFIDNSLGAEQLFSQSDIDSSPLFKTPDDLKNGLLKEKFFTNTQLETLIPDSIPFEGKDYLKNDVKITKVFFDLRSKNWKAEISPTADANKTISEISFQIRENKPVFLESKSGVDTTLTQATDAETKAEEVKAETVEGKIDALPAQISTFVSPFTKQNYVEAKDFTVRNENGIVGIELNAFESKINLIQEADETWNFKDDLMKAKGGYALQFGLALAELALKVKEFRRNGNNLPIFLKDGALVYNKGLSFETFLEKNLVSSLSTLGMNYHPANFNTGWIQNVVNKASRR